MNLVIDFQAQSLLNKKSLWALWPIYGLSPKERIRTTQVTSSVPFAAPNNLVSKQSKESIKSEKKKKNVGSKPIADRSSLRPETSSINPFSVLQIQIRFQKNPLLYLQTPSTVTLKSWRCGPDHIWSHPASASASCASIHYIRFRRAVCVAHWRRCPPWGGDSDWKAWGRRDLQKNSILGVNFLFSLIWFTILY